MRIVGGTWRGRRLEEPRGRDVTRPTTDRVREACASIADSALPEGLQGARVLDAFSGSGAMGIEMLSREAATCAFFDIDRTAAALVRRNLEMLRAESGRWRVTCGDVLAHAARGRMSLAPYDLVLIDPPYQLGPAPAEELLGSLAEQELLASGAIALFEHRSDLAGARLEGFELVREKRYGSTTIDVLRRAN